MRRPSARRVGQMLGRAIVTAALLASAGCLRQDTDTGVIIRASPQPTASAIAPGVYAIGSGVTTPNGNRVAVLAFAGPFPSETSGLVVGAADVQACANPAATGGVNVSADDFELEFTDKTRRPSAPGDRRNPDLRDGTINPGSCTRGWVHFDYRSDEKPAFVVFRSRPPLRWKVT